MNGSNEYSLRNNCHNTSGNTIVNDVSLRDFLYKQIDYMMTVESREMPAEGRRGTHVEVKISLSLVTIELIIRSSWVELILNLAMNFSCCKKLEDVIH